jgi:hypothetical protein
MPEMKLAAASRKGGLALNGRQTRHRNEVANASNKREELRPWLALEHQQKLFAKYPLFFRAVHYPNAYPSNLAFFGIQCGLGWYPIIEAAAQEIERELHMIWCAQAHSPEHIASMDQELRAGTSLHTYVYPFIAFCSEIREITGKLKIAMASGYLFDPQMWDRIRGSIENAEARSATACERCGEPGVFREWYWEHVLCDECNSTKPLVDPFQF